MAVVIVVIDRETVIESGCVIVIDCDWGVLTPICVVIGVCDWHCDSIM